MCLMHLWKVNINWLIFASAKQNPVPMTFTEYGKLEVRAILDPFWANLCIIRNIENFKIIN